MVKTIPGGAKNTSPLTHRHDVSTDNVVTDTSRKRSSELRAEDQLVINDKGTQASTASRTLEDLKLALARGQVRLIDAQAYTQDALKKVGVQTYPLEFDVTVPWGQFRTRVEAFLETLTGLEELF